MQKPYPDRDRAVASAKKLRAELQKTAAGLAPWQDDAFARKRIQAMVDKDGPPVVRSWDSAEQLYLGLHAVNPSKALQDLAKDRAFPPGYGSPAATPAKKLPSFQPREFLDKVRVLTH